MRLTAGAIAILFLIRLAAAADAQECAPQPLGSFETAEQSGGYLGVPLSVDGHQIGAMFCTNCIWSSLGEIFVDRVGIRKLKGHLRFVDWAGNDLKYYAAAREVKIGNILSSDKGEFLIDEGEDGATVGINLMKQFDIEIDNTASAVTLYAYSRCTRPGFGWIANAVEIPFNLKSGSIKAVIELNGRKLSAGVSTGQITTTMSVGIARYQLGITPTSVGVRRIGGLRIGDKVFDRYSTTLPELKFSGLRFTNVPVTLVDIDDYGIDIGLRELKQLRRLYIDFVRKRIYAVPEGT